MAKQFRLGPIQTGRKDNIFISENDADRELNMVEIQRYFHARQQQKCELVICIMDSFWAELRPAIKLNGTVTYGEEIIFISLNLSFCFLQVSLRSA